MAPWHLWHRGTRQALPANFAVRSWPARRVQGPESHWFDPHHSTNHPASKANFKSLGISGKPGCFGFFCWFVLRHAETLDVLSTDFCTQGFQLQQPKVEPRRVGAEHQPGSRDPGWWSFFFFFGMLLPTYINLWHLWVILLRWRVMKSCIQLKRKGISGKLLSWLLGELRKKKPGEERLGSTDEECCEPRWDSVGKTQRWLVRLPSHNLT